MLYKYFMKCDRCGVTFPEEEAVISSYQRLVWLLKHPSEIGWEVLSHSYCGKGRFCLCPECRKLKSSRQVSFRKLKRAYYNNTRSQYRYSIREWLSNEKVKYRPPFYQSSHPKHRHRRSFALRNQCLVLGRDSDKGYRFKHKPLRKVGNVFYCVLPHRVYVDPDYDQLFKCDFSKKLSVESLG